MLRATLRAVLLSAALSLGLGCAYLPQLVPIIAAILADVAEAESKLNTVESLALTYFAEHPDKDAQRTVAVSIATCRASLEGATQVVKGAGELSDGDYDEAFTDFRLAWGDLMLVLGNLGIVSVSSDGMYGAPVLGGDIITPPHALQLRSKP